MHEPSRSPLTISPRRADAAMPGLQQEETLLVLEPPTLMLAPVRLTPVPAPPPRGAPARRRSSSWSGARRVQVLLLLIGLCGALGMSTALSGVLAGDDDPAPRPRGWRKMRQPALRSPRRAAPRRALLSAPRCAGVDQVPPGLTGEALLARGVAALDAGKSDEALYYLCAYRAQEPGPAIDAAVQVLEGQMDRRARQGDRP